MRRLLPGETAEIAAPKAPRVGKVEYARLCMELAQFPAVKVFRLVERPAAEGAIGPISPRSTRSRREFAALTDEQLRATTQEFRDALAAGKTLDDIAAPAFAAVREAAKRTLKQRHFDVQLIGGMVLHEGAIAEMRTGEGKTLVATLASYLNALAGKGVHVVTVNDYLARRDSEWMGQIYGFLGMSVGVIVHGLDDNQRRAGLRRRHHLRHQQRIRLRLSARQYEIRHGRHGAARPCLRDRRRGRFDPGRRGAHAADHFRPVRRPLRSLQFGQRADPPPRARRLSSSTRSSAPSI